MYLIIYLFIIDKIIFWRMEHRVYEAMFKNYHNIKDIFVCNMYTYYILYKNNYLLLM